MTLTRIITGPVCPIALATSTACQNQDAAEANLAGTLGSPAPGAILMRAGSANAGGVTLLYDNSLMSEAQAQAYAIADCQDAGLQLNEIMHGGPEANLPHTSKSFWTCN